MCGWCQTSLTRAVRRPVRAGLTIPLREGGRFRAVPASHAFPGWTADDIHRALNEPKLSEQTAAVLDRVGRALGAPEGTGPDDDPRVGRWRRESRAAGRAEAQRANALKVLKVRGIPVSASLAEQLAQMEGDSERLVDAALACRDEADFLRLVAPA